MSYKEFILVDLTLNITDGTHSTVKNNPEGNCLLLSAKNIKNGRVITNEKDRKINTKTLDKLKKRTSTEFNDVLLTTVGTIGEVARVTERNPNYEFQRSVAILKPDPNIVDPDYFFYQIKSNDFKNRAISHTSGSVQKCLFLKTIRNMKLKICEDKFEQKAIANILSSLDDKIECNNKINKNLEEIAQTLYKHWFVDFEFPNEDGDPYKSNDGEMIECELGLIPKGWKVDVLTNVANYKNGLAVKKYAPSENKKSYPVLKIKELRSGDCDHNSDRVTTDFPKDYIIYNGDLIFSWSGTLMVDFWTGKTAGLNQHLFKVNSDNHDRWFYYYWTSFHLSKFQNIASSMATTMGHIKRTDLKKSKVIIPTRNIYSNARMLFEPILDLILKNRNESNRLKNLRDTLLPKLMSGEIRVPIKE